MVDFFENMAYAWGVGYIYVFFIPAVIICGIVLFEICDSAVRAWRRRRQTPEAGVYSWEEIRLEAPLLHAEPSETTLKSLRKWHHRRLDPILTQPFAKQPNRPVSDAYRWG